MFSNKLHHFIFIEKTTQRVVKIKQSKEIDCSFESDQFTLYVLVSADSLPNEADFDWEYNPRSGFVKINFVLDAESKNTLSILRSKIEAILVLKTSLQMLRNGIENSYVTNKCSSLINDEDYKIYTEFIIKEKNIINERMNSFMQMFESRIMMSQTIIEVKSELRQITSNYAMGVYFPLSDKGSKQ